MNQAAKQAAQKKMLGILTRLVAFYKFTLADVESCMALGYFFFLTSLLEYNCFTMCVLAIFEKFSF